MKILILCIPLRLCWTDVVNIQNILPALSETEISTALNLYNGNVEQAVELLLNEDG